MAVARPMRLFLPVAVLVVLLVANLVLPRFSDSIASLPFAQAEVWIRQLLAAALWLAGAWGVNRLIEAVVWEGVLAHSDGRRVPKLLRDMVWLGLLAITGMAILAFVFDQSVTGLLTTSGILVAIVGFALRDIIADLFCGIFLSVENPFSVGDWLCVADETTGRVVDINWRATRLMTRDEEVVILPNSLIARNQFINLSRPVPRYRCTMEVYLELSVPVNQAERVIQAALIDCELRAQDREPSVCIGSFGDRGVVYLARFWPKGPECEAECRHEVGAKLLYHLEAAGLEVSYAKEDMLLIRSRTERVQQRPRKLELLRHVHVFDSLTQDDLNALAKRMNRQLVHAGDPVVEQYEEGSSMFVVAEGLLDVSIDVDGVSRQVGRVRPNQFLGEMSLLTGEPRSATVIAVTDVQLYEITKEDFEPLVDSNPELLSNLGVLLAERQARMHRVRQTAQNNPDPASQETVINQFVTRMRRFFNVQGSPASS